MKILVDPQDNHLLTENWKVQKYVTRFYCVDGVPHTEYLHRRIMQPLKNEIVTHVNGDPLDNRRCNLRVLALEDSHHRSRKRKGSNLSSKYKGVSKDHRANKWRAYIYANRKRIYLGRFDTEREAAQAYNKAALTAGLTAARLNDL